MDNITLETAKKRLTRVRTQILTTDPGLTKLCLLIPVKIRLEDTDTVAYTDGDAIYLCYRWFSDYSVEQQGFIYLHELCHVLFRHVQFVAERNLRHGDVTLHNIAADAVINYLLSENQDLRSVIQKPADGICIAKVTQELSVNKSYNEWSAWDLYLALRDKINNAHQQIDVSVGSSSNPLQNQATSNSSAPQDTDSTSPSPLDNLSHNRRQAITQPLNIKDFKPDLMKPQFTDGQDGLTDEQKEFQELPESAKSAILRKVVESGIGSSSLLRSLSKKFDLPTINWHAIVRQFLRTYCSPKFRDNWRRPNRLTLSGVIKHFEPARGRYKSLYRVGWIVDTSGSMNEEDLYQGLQLIASCRTHYEFDLVLLSADAEVCSRERFKASVKLAEKIKKGEIKLKGGGGTDFRPALEAIAKENPTLVFYYTDGYGTFPDKVDFPVIWLVTTDVKAPMGTTVHINDS